jgi:hypothetical protein
MRTTLFSLAVIISFAFAMPVEIDDTRVKLGELLNGKPGNATPATFKINKDPSGNEHVTNSARKTLHRKLYGKPLQDGNAAKFESEARSKKQESQENLEWKKSRPGMRTRGQSCVIEADEPEKRCASPLTCRSASVTKVDKEGDTAVCMVPY